MNLLEDVDVAIPAIGAALAHADVERWQSIASAELLAPVPRPGKVVAIGRNYREHAEEEGVDRRPRR